MNKQTRARLQALYDKICSLIDDLDSITMDQQSIHDNIPENLQASQRGEAQEEIVGFLDDALDSFRSGLDSLQEAINR